MTASATPEDIFAAAMTGRAPARLGLAVSGGGDSIALLHLAHAWGRAAGVGLSAVTVDHGLRPEAATEARFVAEICARLGVAHDTLRWTGWDGRGNLQAAARAARYRLMAGWAHERGIGAIALGHTMDDQAETFLMRLARGSGPDGLSGMAASHRRDAMIWLRPLLDLRRDALRAWLGQHGQGWIDDPSNRDRRFDRVRVRQALDGMRDIGLTVEGLAETCTRMAMTRAALDHLACETARSTGVIDRGDLLFDSAGLDASPRETRLRLLAAALCWVASAEYRPRLAALETALDAALSGRRRSLHGCLLTPDGPRLRISREPAAVRDTRAAPDRPWDTRWRFFGPKINGVQLRALGETGLACCKGWRETGLPRASLLASPAVWRGDELIAAPLAGHCNGWRAELTPPAEAVLQAIISH